MAKNKLPALAYNATQRIAQVNGKSYTLLHYYTHHLTGPFFLAVAGKTPLKSTDLADHWKVIRHGHVYFALYARLFSYHLLGGHLLMGEGTATDLRHWPKLKTTDRLAFVGPTADAIRTQVRLTLERYQYHLDLDQAIATAMTVEDKTGHGPDALVLRISELDDLKGA